MEEDDIPMRQPGSASPPGPPTPPREQPKMQKRKVLYDSPPKQPKLESPFEGSHILRQPTALQQALVHNPAARTSTFVPTGSVFRDMQQRWGTVGHNTSVGRRPAGGTKRKKLRKQKRKTKKHGRR